MGNAADLDGAVPRLAAGQLVAAPGPDRLPNHLWRAPNLCRWGMVAGSGRHRPAGLKPVGRDGSASCGRPSPGCHRLACLPLKGSAPWRTELIGRPAFGLGAPSSLPVGAWWGWQGLMGGGLMLAVLTGALLVARQGWRPARARDPLPFVHSWPRRHSPPWVAGKSWWLSADPRFLRRGAQPLMESFASSLYTHCRCSTVRRSTQRPLGAMPPRRWKKGMALGSKCGSGLVVYRKDLITNASVCIGAASTTHRQAAPRIRLMADEGSFMPSGP